LIYERGYFDKTAAVVVGWVFWIFCFVALQKIPEGRFSNWLFGIQVVARVLVKSRHAGIFYNGVKENIQ